MTAQKFYSGIDLTQTSLNNAVAHPLSGAPSAPKFGQFYFNTTANVLFVYNGTSWRPTDAAALTDGSIAITALATNPLARANHTGVQTSATISDLAATVKAYTLDTFAAPVASVAFGNQRLTGLSDPTGAQDAATKNYVDGAVQNAAAGIDSKPSVRVVATSNITLSGTQTIDGVSLAAGDRVLATAQSTGSQNGVYVVASGAWARATDADQTGEITPGAFWFVEEGSANGKTQWRCNNTGTVTIGTTAITIVQFGAASSYSAGNGLQLTGTVFAVLLPTGSGLTASASGVAIDTTVVARKYAGTITHDGSTTSFTITHGLGTKNVVPSFRDSSDIAVSIDWTASTVNAITVNFGAAQSNGTAFTVAVVG